MIDVRQVITEYLEYLTKTGDDDPKDYRLVLNRIAADCRAHDALNAMVTKNNGDLWELLDLCVYTEFKLTTFHKLLAAERATVERLQQYRKSVEDLRQFITEATKFHEHPMVGWYPLDEKTDPRRVAKEKRLAAELGWEYGDHGDLYPVRAHIGYQKGADFYYDALDRIAVLIDERQQCTDDAMAQLGVSRKCHTKTAAETAAIGLLAEGVVDIVGKPFAQQVAVLAEIAFAISEVSEDRVRAALKRRQQLVEFDA